MNTNGYFKSITNTAGRSQMGPTRYQIGARVRSVRYGEGRVLALNPDGCVIVRFDGLKKSLPVFPSLLEKGK